MKIQISSMARALAARRRVQRLPFQNRAEAGHLLAQRLLGFTRQEDSLVLTLPTGGVAVACEVSRVLHLPLDVLLARPLRVAQQPEQVIGALAADGGTYLDYALVRAAGLSPDALSAALDTARCELKRQKRRFRKGLSALPLEGRVAILVDDGAATAAALLAAVHALRRLRPAKLVMALPLCAEAVCRLLAPLADLLVVLKRPVAFYAIEKTYLDNPVLADADVLRLLTEHRAAMTPPGDRRMPGR